MNPDEWGGSANPDDMSVEDYCITNALVALDFDWVDAFFDWVDAFFEERA